MKTILEVRNLTVRYASTVIVDTVSFDVAEGEWVMLAGPNGAGKSTIVGAIAQSVPSQGEILFEGKNLRKMKPGVLARNVGVLMQRHSVEYAFTVEEIVRLGRYSHPRNLLNGKTKDDDYRVDEAIRMTGLERHRNQSVLTLSGGELQRTFLAQAFAQDPRLLILDEPTNHLDLKYQQQVFELVRDWLSEPGRAVLSVVHDLSLARAYGSRAVLLNKGKICAQGDMEAVFCRKNLAEVYDMDVYDWMQGLLSQWQ